MILSICCPEPTSRSQKTKQNFPGSCPFINSSSLSVFTVILDVLSIKPWSSIILLLFSKVLSLKSALQFYWRFLVAVPICFLSFNKYCRLQICRRLIVQCRLILLSYFLSLTHHRVSKLSMRSMFCRVHNCFDHY